MTPRLRDHWRTIGLILALASAAPGADEPRPNVVVIVADDLGWADVGWHGGSIPTPNLDRLARGGVRLEQHYVAPVCSPTRAALMTGRYWSRFGVTNPSNERVLPFDTLTLPRALKAAGYATAQVGKWHLGSKPEWGPNRFGFDRGYGSLAGGVGPWDHRYKTGPFTHTWHRDGRLIEEEGHVTDLIAAEAVRWLDARPNTPFFLYAAFSAPHIPIKEPAEWLERVASIADPMERQYAACVAHLDDAVGRIAAALERTGQIQNTLIVFTSDNGGIGTARNDDPAYPPDDYQPGRSNGQNRPLRGQKGTLYEGGIRVPAFVSWPARLEPRVLDAPISVSDWMPTLCRLVGFEPEADPRWDGRDLTGVLLRGEPAGERTLYWAGTGFRSSALRRGDLKLVVHRDPDGEETRVELFDLAADPVERVDLAPSRPETVAELKEALRDQMTKDRDAVAGPGR